MTQDEKWKKVIEKVNKNRDGSMYGALWSLSDGSLTVENSAVVIFTHAFLKCAFGEEKIKDGSDLRCPCGEKIPYLHRTPAWQYHGCQLFLTEEDKRVDYLYAYLFGEGKV
jgi:DNA-directed RNA polymerase subunit RPC12/RpoP